ncbi:PREDICTED: uncharacterized protein LOC106808848 [Priapulus caudatus]|uniref:Uncharacterized protein LOC106808848 n=1 Tax=Priapulus caudatus TaxID=37621 RepID=A0ABM1E4W0_PRICU|nr:PREDICTED: uncharacterized protein LOC106808848 [Priapulus caudatus]XP_014667231.1 PREDICTED: uncharacterized protein LOC106808848 [Priapulus caudatus]
MIMHRGVKRRLEEELREDATSYSCTMPQIMCVSMWKLQGVQYEPESNLLRSVLICNTLKHIEREVETLTVIESTPHFPPRLPYGNIRSPAMQDRITAAADMEESAEDGSDRPFSWSEDSWCGGPSGGDKETSLDVGREREVPSLLPQLESTKQFNLTKVVNHQILSNGCQFLSVPALKADDGKEGAAPHLNQGNCDLPTICYSCVSPSITVQGGLSSCSTLTDSVNCRSSTDSCGAITSVVANRVVVPGSTLTSGEEDKPLLTLQWPSSVDFSSKSLMNFGDLDMSLYDYDASLPSLSPTKSSALSVEELFSVPYVNCRGSENPIDDLETIWQLLVGGMA